MQQTCQWLRAAGKLAAPELQPGAVGGPRGGLAGMGTGMAGEESPSGLVLHAACALDVVS